MELVAPSDWQCIDFLSDIHLDADQNATFELWRSYLKNTPADAVFLLGDVFEVWVGDDVLSVKQSFERQCVDVLQAAGSRLSLFIMAGNRDFLMGAELMARCNARAIEDPCTLIFNGNRIVLSHGDALCTADTDYQAFRTLVRGHQWQSDFLNRPLADRQAVARELRKQSEMKKQALTAYADVDSASALRLLDATDADILIHGHTHLPGRVELRGQKYRVVLSDWIADATPPRADVLRLRPNGESFLTVSRLLGNAIATAQD